jgi:hypothetical protein
MLPAENGTTILTIRFGNDPADWAEAELAKAAENNAAAHARTSRKNTNILPNLSSPS